MSTFDDRHVMRRVIALAARGYGVVHPNPMVGCVIVKDGQVVGEGWHRVFGGPHAEVDALRNAGTKARGGVLYVNLEPCVHHGKTPPCTEAIKAAGIAEIVVAVKDPHRLVSGKGLSALRSAGVKVRLGAGRDEAERLNERFLTCHREARPFVGLKWAQSVDGRVVDHRGASQWITGPDARREAHRLRAGYDAVLVGAGTVLADDPRLTVRDAPGRSPVRVVVDGRLKITGGERVFKEGARRILITDRAKLVRPGPTIRRLLALGVDVAGLPGAGPYRPGHLLAVLYGEGLTSVMVEGGPGTLAAFVQEGAFDKVHAFVGPIMLGGGRSSLALKRPFDLRKPLRLSRATTKVFEDGSLLLEGYREL
ncbi:MAG: bifunctional diaminohydroxyphosphoribosylaminopyrimidine deaminase/5-amino-6-(5-phosphoribosylamino)uracil reductase RibD [Bacteroidetes bacterium]|jgi:diaminohydroxyphosphoribosylaminopyrimidine deaminase/5-amino-6-(5-phosphoribosylamino)uracil reductase|nr:bifunctional diaminohydroxyphosphoribosylaminopyrimidine deaminase/5-amino-6-(5-phosphoribosylamino)uracil reductase RibD [Bacteroidota bacterium]